VRGGRMQAGDSGQLLEAYRIRVLGERVEQIYHPFDHLDGGFLGIRRLVSVFHRKLVQCNKTLYHNVKIYQTGQGAVICIDWSNLFHAIGMSGRQHSQP
jgi:hypothetical protein